MSYRVQIPDTDSWKKQIKCQSACPVGTDARGYIQAITEGDFEKAYLIARGPNPLASICGRICGAPCETECRRGDIDNPISIRALKRHVCERYGTEVRADAELAVIEKIRESIGSRACAGLEEAGFLTTLLDRKRIPRGKGEGVGVIGSGPAGLAAAHDLALLGFSPVVYEVEAVPAGMLFLGVPEYRLPRDIILAEVSVIEALGVRILTGMEVGRNITLGEVIETHAAVIIAVGAKKSRKMQIPGEEAENVYGGVEFLREVALGNHVSLGRRVVVVGGGNVAFDVSRTALRHEESDVSRTAVRLAGVREVHLCCLESKAEMPADETELREGEEEGIIRHNRVGPKEIVLDDSGRATAVRFAKAVRVFDDEGKFAPEFDMSASTELPADAVLLAIGQAYDLSFIDPNRDGLELNERGMIRIDDNLATTREGVFVAGDLATGPKLMIDAIASGKRAARSVYQYLTQHTLPVETTATHLPLDSYRRLPGYEGIPRQTIPAAPVPLRIKSVGVPIERGLTREAALLEAQRCLDCGVNTILDGSKCILCGGCVDVCPELCLKLVPIEEVKNDSLAELSHRTLGERLVGGATVMIKDGTRCIRCGLCAERCPVGAITMERFRFQEVLI